MTTVTLLAGVNNICFITKIYKTRKQILIEEIMNFSNVKIIVSNEKVRGVTGGYTVVGDAINNPFLFKRGI